VTSPLYLIAHSVRGEAAFDVATQMECPHCQGCSNEGREPYVCFDCDDKGWWWIIPTSGHRAFPYWTEELIGILQLAFDEQYIIKGQPGLVYDGEAHIPEMPPSWPDHYRVGPTPTLNIMSLFKAQREAKPHIPRRL